MIRSPVKSQIAAVAITPIMKDTLRFKGVQWKSFSLLYIVFTIIFTS